MQLCRGKACVMRSMADAQAPGGSPARRRLWLESVLGTVGAWAPRSEPRRGVLLDRGPPISKRLLVTAEGRCYGTWREAASWTPHRSPLPASLLATVGFRCCADSLRLGARREPGLWCGVCPVVLLGP